MTQEDKELLLKDLCARSPYGVKIACGQYDKNPRKVNSISIVDIGTFLNGYFNKGIQLDFNGNKELWPKPYLRPMSSMTEEERADMGAAIEKDCISPYGEIKSSGVDNLLLCTVKGSSNLIDWLNKKMFDYRTDDEGKTMIEKGLALKAPEGMYN